MSTVRVRQKLESETLTLPELRLMIGETVEITIESRSSDLAPPADERPDLRRRFHDLVRQWKEATRFLSSVHDLVGHPAYLQIIGMGREALPLLLEELRREPDHWFAALQAITGTNPIPEFARGDVDRMTRAWLTWAEQHGL